MSAYSSMILATTGLVAYWRLGEPSGSTAVDAAVGHDGTYSGMTLGTTGLLAKDADTAITVPSGFGAKVDIADHADFATTSVSVEAWIKPSSTFTAGAPIFRRSSASAGGYTLQNGNSSGEIFWYVYTGGYNELQSTGWTANVAAHIVATYDGHFQRLYRNGALIATGADLNAAINNPATPNVVIGMDPFTQSWAGVVDEVAVYSTALSLATIQAHYNLGLTGPTSGQINRQFQLRPY